MTAIEMNQTFIIAAYAVTWVALLAYAARLARTSERARAAYERAVPRAGDGKGGR